MNRTEYMRFIILDRKIRNDIKISGKEFEQHELYEQWLDVLTILEQENEKWIKDFKKFRGIC